MPPVESAAPNVRLQRFDTPVPYDDARSLQRDLADEVRGGADEALILLQHEPVFTLGRRARYHHVLVDREALSRRGAELVETDRGGDVTFHGPGQLVAYPVLNLKARHLGPAAYVRLLEQCVIDVLAEFGIDGERVPGRPGVWGGGAKVAAVGVRLQGGVSTHGIALNVDIDLAWFELIVPCGLADAGVSSMRRLLGYAPRLDRVADAFERAFIRNFDSALTSVGPTSHPETVALRL